MIHFSSGLRWRGETYLFLVWLDTAKGRTLLLDIKKPKWLQTCPKQLDK